MKILSSISDVPELTKSSVKVRSESELLAKLNKLICDGSNTLQIVTDFDHTLTRHHLDDGSSALTSFGMFGQCPSVPQHYKDEDQRLASIYKPIESCPKMSLQEKTEHMVQWYIAANQIMKGLHFPKDELKVVSQKMIKSFRIGVEELIKWCESHDVPMLVFSAGLGDCVVAALTAAGYLLPHVKVVSNFLSLDADDGTIVGIKGEIIHTLNKNETAIKHTDYYEMVRHRSNVLVMGDNIGDAGMAEGMEHCDVVLKVGFLGRHLQADSLNNYLNTFDIVLVDDSTMDIPNAILKLIL